MADYFCNRHRVGPDNLGGGVEVEKKLGEGAKKGEKEGIQVSGIIREEVVTNYLTTKSHDRDILAGDHRGSMRST